MAPKDCLVTAKLLNASLIFGGIWKPSKQLKVESKRMLTIFLRYRC